MLTYYVAVSFVLRVFGVTREEAFSTLDDVVAIKTDGKAVRPSTLTFAWEDVWEVACARFGVNQYVSATPSFISARYPEGALVIVDTRDTQYGHIVTTGIVLDVYGSGTYEVAVQIMGRRFPASWTLNDHEIREQIGMYHTDETPMAEGAGESIPF